ncbi:MAG: ORF6N domain-containing protein, partial [Bacteroidota bacterium]
MNEIQIAEEKLLSSIFVVKEQKVMLDSDLAFLYGVETRTLNQAVKRNFDRFPIDFMFQLSEEEW